MTDAFEAKYAPPTPPVIIRTAVKIISPQTPAMYQTFCSAMPTLTMLPYRLGSRISPSTSTIMHSGPMTK